MTFRFYWIAVSLLAFKGTISQGAEKNAPSASLPVAAIAISPLSQDFSKDLKSLLTNDQSTFEIPETGAKKDVQNPKRSRELFIRGSQYLDKRDFDKAIEDFNVVIKLDPEQGLAYYARGVAFFEKGEFGK